MLVQRISNNQITITFSSAIDAFSVQRLINYSKYIEATSKSKAKQIDVDKIADEVNANWFKTSGKKILK